MPREIDEMVTEISRRRTELETTVATAEESRTAPPALVDLLRELRVSMAKVPVELGGDELAPPDQLRYFEALSYANPTAGWIGFVHAGATGLVGARIPDASVERIFGDGRAPLCAGVAAPSGTCERTSGGFIANGVWKFASGARHCDYALVTARDARDRGAAYQLTVPFSDLTLHDDWHTMSQQGTGSVDVALRDVFVPDEMVLIGGADPPRGGPLYHSMNPTTYIAGENGGFTLGVAQRFMDDLAVYAATKSRGGEGLLGERGAFLFEFGKAELQIQAARSLMQSVLLASWEICSANRGLTQTERARVAGTLTFATSSCADAVTRLFHFAGAGALHTTSTLQRCFRDIHGSAQHYLASNASYERYASAIIARGGRSDTANGEGSSVNTAALIRH